MLKVHKVLILKILGVFNVKGIFNIKNPQGF